MELVTPDSSSCVLACSIIILGIQQKGKVFTLAARQLPSILQTALLPHWSPSNELTGAMFTLQLPLKFEGLTLRFVSFDINDASQNGSPSY